MGFGDKASRLGKQASDGVWPSGFSPTHQLEKVTESRNDGLLLPGWLHLLCEHEAPELNTCVLLAA